jgi:hypothetical protein
MAQDEVQVAIERFGPDEQAVATAVRTVNQSHQVQEYLANTRYRGAFEQRG